MKFRREPTRYPHLAPRAEARVNLALFCDTVSRRSLFAFSRYLGSLYRSSRLAQRIKQCVEAVGGVEAEGAWENMGYTVDEFGWVERRGFISLERHNLPQFQYPFPPPTYVILVISVCILHAF